MSFFNVATHKFDRAEKSYENSANASIFGYTTTGAMLGRTGWFNRDEMGDIKNLATANPTINYNGGGPGFPSQQVDANSNLINAKNWRVRGRQTLEPRAYATTPYFGFGSGTTDQETSSDLLFSTHQRQPKSIGTTTDKQTWYYDAPLIDEKYAQVHDSKYWIEEDAADGWVRGGVPTRVVRVKSLGNKPKTS